MFNLLLVVLFFPVYDASAQGNCITPLGRIGTCVLIQDCKYMVNILKAARQDKFSQQYMNFLKLLKASLCGSDGTNTKICCEQLISQNFTQNPPNVLNHPNLRLLDHRLCGVFSNDNIFGGSKTGVFDFPWMALIIYRTSKNGDLHFRCGGSIINKRYILTAAHCVATLPKTLTLHGVRVGEHDLNNITDCDIYYNRINNSKQEICTEGFQEFGIEKIHVHPEFSTKTYQNDIALLRLKRDIDFEPQNVRPICLPIGSAERYYGNQATITGWGATEYGPQSSKLLIAKLPLVSNAQCSDIYRELKLEINYSQMCAGGESGRDSCSGDSGGPLQNPGNYYGKSRYVQYGIVSYGKKTCGIPGTPAVYTRVSYFMDWILNSIRN